MKMFFKKVWYAFTTAAKAVVKEFVGVFFESFFNYPSNAVCG